jgi:hypothetical protein
MKKLVLLAVLGSVVVASVWSARRTEQPAETDSRLLSDRIWIDHIPRNERDTIHVFLALSEVSIGVFQATSQWRGNFEGFRYEASGNELRMVFPQTGDREAVRTKARRCTEQQMDFCLELDGTSRGAKKYYSREGWEIDRHADLDAVKRRIETLRGQLAAGH